MAYPAIFIFWLFFAMLLMPQTSHSMMSGGDIGYSISRQMCQGSQFRVLGRHAATAKGHGCAEIIHLYRNETASARSAVFRSFPPLLSAHAEAGVTDGEYSIPGSFIVAALPSSYGIGYFLSGNSVSRHPVLNNTGFSPTQQYSDVTPRRQYRLRRPINAIAMPLQKGPAVKPRQPLRFETQRMRNRIYPEYIEIGHEHSNCDKSLSDGLVKSAENDQSERFTDDPDSPREIEKLRQMIFIASAVAAIFIVITGMLLALLRRLKKEIQRGKKLELEIRNVAFYDPLTKLPNRRLLFERLQQAISQSTRRKAYGAILFLDLDKFKVLNDTRGHDVGDLLLIEVAQRLQACVREEDTVARLGGDEFVVMLENLGNNANYAAARARKVGLKVLDVLSRPYLLKDREFHSSSSIGISLFINRKETPSDLLKRSDTAMYQAKNGGRNTLRFFDPAMQKSLDGRIRFEKEMRLAIINREYRLCYQLQVDSGRQPVGAEALLRWEHPQRGLLLPRQFMPLAEETDLSEAIGLWVLETACAQLQDWQSQPRTRNLSLAINIGSRQFHHPEFVTHIQEIIDASSIDPTKLKIELTERLVQKDMRLAIDKMHPLKSMGVKFSLDDFGIGHSSLNILKKLPLDQLKIDLSLVRDLTTDARTAAIVRAIIDISNTLGFEVIAEGVETEEQFDYLSRNGCLAFQGYLFGNLKTSAELIPDSEYIVWSPVTLAKHLL